MEQFKSILRQYWGYPDFRGIQADIISNVAQGHDTLGLMPTGGGKSITFQVPALAMEGLCLVVTPLIALMKDQVYHLRQRGIQAAAVFSGQTREEILRHLDNAIFGAYKFLYVSPERLATPLFLNKVSRMKVCLITVDEAHCISQWGYDFRPHYLRIAEVRRLLPGVPVLALTATATVKVVEDICLRLDFQDGKVFRMSFERPNLRYVVRTTQDKNEELLHILQRVPGSAIVYTRNRRNTGELAEWLRQQGISALNYHAGLTTLDKDMRQQAWQCNDVRVMVATNAFGMGIDKPDVRLVVHMDVPDSPEAYFQEAGRGGRDGKTSYAVLLNRQGDTLQLRQRIAQTFPERDYIRKVYTDLSSFYQIGEGEAEGRTFQFNMDRFCRVFRHFPVLLESALNLLTQAGYIQYNPDGENTSRVIFLLQRDELYDVHYLNREEDAVLNALLRLNGGFFADYVPIEEDRLGELCGLTAEKVYELLKNLSMYRIINYIPHNNTPQITYTMRRVDTCYVEIPPSIYEQRREVYQQRIEAMTKYIEQQELCRSRYLLRYFNDDADDCGCCDVCLTRKKGTATPAPKDLVRQCMEKMLQVLADGAAHNPENLLKEDFLPQVRDKALRTLVEEEKIRIDGLQVRLADNG
ncbi:MAG: RecQ family ATP-dependent DNA helicase [Bacteroidales bacterium]|nr:RecQ family ATP-dependent DNA helicase [Bacteroidales bacterium]MCI7050288.1 RecQ family ATP-dependent DNA helicase [Bacteroidales bacterium]MDD6732316.1 RecQ family ATP-dependent DNA helicase [Bacteroidales bacterium]